MKFFKKIVSATMAIAMIASITTIASAATLDSFKQAQYSVYVDKATIEQGTTTFTVNIGIKDSTGETIDIPQETSGKSSFYATLSDEAQAAGIKFETMSSTVATVYDVDTDNETYFGCCIVFDKSNVNLSASTPIMTATFSAPAGIEVGTYNLVCSTADGDGMQLIDKDNNNSSKLTWDPTPIVTVTAAGGSGSSVTATAAGTSADGKITAYTITGDDNVSKVIAKTFTDLPTITDATRVYVTIDGEPRVFGSDLAEATKDLDIGKLTFGIIVNGTVDLSKITQFEVK